MEIRKALDNGFVNDESILPGHRVSFNCLLESEKSILIIIRIWNWYQRLTELNALQYLDAGTSDLEPIK